MTYAAKTRVPVEKTKLEIEQIVRRYGATGFASSWSGDKARIEFRVLDRHIRFTMTEPPAEQAKRQKWRALALVIKSRLESIEAGIATFESAFAMETIVPSTGKTVWETIKEPLAVAYQSGKPVSLLEGPAL